MSVNISHLRSFYAVAKLGSVAEAARELMATPSVVAMHVKQLEGTVGIRLLVREGNSVQPTRAGQPLFKKAHRIFHEIRETEALLEDIFRRKGAELRIGCPDTPVNYLMPKLISQFNKAYPGVRIVVNQGRDATMVKSIEDRRNELAVIRYRPNMCRLRIKFIGKEELALTAAAISVHAPGSEMSVRQLANLPLAIAREGSAVREAVIDYLRKFKINPRVALESSSEALLKEFVRHDNGIGFIERGAIEEELNQGFLKTVRLLEGPPAIEIGFGYRGRSELSPTARAFLRVLGKSGGLPFLH